MVTQSQISNKPVNALAVGSNIVALAGVGLVGYGIMFLVRNFTGLIELGLTPSRVGGTPEQISAFSQDLYNYIIHIQTALAGFIIAMGVVVLALAVFGIRRGERWALWTVFLAYVIAVGIGLPLHYPFHFATLGHLGLIYLDVAILLIGTVVSYRAIKA